MAQELVHGHGNEHQQEHEHGLEDAKQFARILYVAHGATFLFSLGTLSFLVLIVNYLRRPETAGTMVYSHHTWMIRSFWFYALWMVVGALLWFTIVLPFVVWGIAWIWMAYRIIRGFLDLNNNRAMPV